MEKPPVRILARTDVERLLDMSSCIQAVSDAFRRRAEGHAAPSAVLGVHVAGGGFHAKAAMLELARPYFVTKVNANFPGNPATQGLPTIQGVLVLFDAACGVPLAVMDSMSITTVRTAAASAVAASALALPTASTLTIVGCGVQAGAHLAAFASVRTLECVSVFDTDRAKAERFAREVRGRYEFRVEVAADLPASTRTSAMVATCTSATAPFLGPEDLAPGTFVAAVGADNEHKSEIRPSLMKQGVVIVDDLEQCATIGDLHHAISAGVVSRADVRAALGDVVAGRMMGRTTMEEIIVFDSTGVAIEDVAAAALVYERAMAAGAGLGVAIGE